MAGEFAITGVTSPVRFLGHALYTLPGLPSQIAFHIDAIGSAVGSVASMKATA